MYLLKDDCKKTEKFTFFFIHSGTNNNHDCNIKPCQL